MKKEYKGKISIGRYVGSGKGDCYVEIEMEDNLCPRVLFEMAQQEFAKAITGLSNRPGDVTVWVKDKEDNNAGS